MGAGHLPRCRTVTGQTKIQTGEKHRAPLHAASPVYLLISKQLGKKSQGKSQELWPCPEARPSLCPQAVSPHTLLHDIPPFLNTGTSPSPRVAIGCDSHPQYSHPPHAASSFLWNHVSCGAEAAHFCAGTSESTGRIKEHEEFPSLILSVRLEGGFQHKAGKGD